MSVHKRGGISFQGVSKQFRRLKVDENVSYTTIKSSILSPSQWFSDNPRKNFTALYPLDLEVDPGSSIGIIGRNGSGKSTLLKLVAGIYRPDSGKIIVSGRVSALIELGAGISSDFTGRENIYLGGAMYGLSRWEIEKKIEDIICFSELAPVIDNPVRTYSSGMFMRLGFSLAIFTDPDILLVDEVLAVGDASFVRRCQEAIRDFKRCGKTLFFVAHDLGSVERWCDEVIWLDKGKVAAEGVPRIVIDLYLSSIREQSGERLQQENEENERRVAKYGEKSRWGSKEVEISDVCMSDAESGVRNWAYQQSQSVKISFDLNIRENVEELVCGVGILRTDGLTVYGTNTYIDGFTFPERWKKGDLFKVEFKIDRIELLDGSWYLDVATHAIDGTPYDYHHRMYKFSVQSKLSHNGIFNPKHSWKIFSEHSK